MVRKPCYFKSQKCFEKNVIAALLWMNCLFYLILKTDEKKEMGFTPTMKYFERSIIIF